MNKRLDYRLERAIDDVFGCYFPKPRIDPFGSIYDRLMNDIDPITAQEIERQIKETFDRHCMEAMLGPKNAVDPEHWSAWTTTATAASSPAEPEIPSYIDLVRARRKTIIDEVYQGIPMRSVEKLDDVEPPAGGYVLGWDAGEPFDTSSAAADPIRGVHPDLESIDDKPAERPIHELDPFDGMDTSYEDDL